MDIKFNSKQSDGHSALVLLVNTGGKLDSTGTKINNSLGNRLLNRAIISDTVFDGKRGQLMTLHTPFHLGMEKIILLGTGNADSMDDNLCQDLGGILYKELEKQGITNPSIQIGTGDKFRMDGSTIAANMAYGMRMRSYKFDKYRSEKNKNTFDTDVSFTLHNYKKAKIEFKNLDAIASGINLARDLVNEPANTLNPESYASKIKHVFNGVKGVSIKVLNEKDMEKLGMNSLLSVGTGSKKKSQTVIMEYNGNNSKEAPVALVGKGVTFDSGGLSLKSGAGMQSMKYDMGGSASVVGAMKAIAERGSKSHVIGIVGLVENMPDANATRPGDVIKSMSGQTIEVLNTDAEGRLVLADIMTYVQRTYKPKAMIDLATLTGAITHALGSEYAGTFSNNDNLVEQIKSAGDRVKEKTWRMPLCDTFRAAMHSNISDLRNTSKIAGAGSSTAAAFLEHFVENDTPWVHIDIAGVLKVTSGGPTSPDGLCNAYGVRLLNEFIKANHETPEPKTKPKTALKVKPNKGSSPS